MLSDYQKYRIYEMLPGILVWSTLIILVSLSILRPLWMIYFVIVFSIYWVLKVTNFSFYLLVAWNRFRKARASDWKNRLAHEIDNWQDKRHVVFLTLYDEEWEVVRTSIESIRDSVYEKEKFVIVIAGEENKKEHFEYISEQVKQTFGEVFFDIVCVMHPKDLPGEIQGKGSNLHYAERHMKEYIDEKKWDYDKIIATVFDIDTVVHPQYFSYLTYVYCTHPNPTRSSYQPIALYNNNIWESPAALRIMAFGTTFWTFTSLARQDALVTFSSHSMSFRALVDAGFHEKRIVSEDSRIFYQCLLAYDGNYSVAPLYIPVSMDTVRDEKWINSLKNLYKQQRRWAWGVEHVPFLLWEFGKKGNKIPFWKKFKWVFVEWEGKWSWCMVAIIITIVGRLPMWIASGSIRQSAFFFNAPHVLSNLMTISMIGMILSASFSLALLPKRPESQPSYKYIIMLLQWLLLPITMIFISSIPAIDATTHLMFGKYLGFNVSQKKRDNRSVAISSLSK